MNNENYIIHFDELSKVMKKAHLWKYVAFGTVCIKQEYEIYEELAKNKFFDMGKFLKKTIERFWQAASTGYSMDEKYILAVEESMFSPRDGWEELALQFIYDLQDFFYAVADKDKNRCLEMQKRQLDFIEKYVQVAGLSNEQQKILEERAIEKHLKIALELIDIPAKDKKSFLAELSCREIDKLLGEELIGYKFDSKKEKPAKKKLPEIRATSLDFDKEKKANNNTWLMDSTPEQWVLGPECDINQRGAYAEYYREKDLLDLCYVMAVRYHLFAYDDYIQHRDAKRAQGFWYLSALTWLRAYQLRENGYPIKWVPYFERHMAGADGFQPVVGKMLCAYASGEEWLVPEIQHFSSENEKVLTVPLLKLLAGESSDKIYPMVEAWDDCVWKKIVIAILNEDKKEIRKLILQMIRNDRQAYDMYRTMVDAEAYAFMRLAKERGIDIAPIIAAEVLDGVLDVTPVDKNFFKLPYQEEIDNWLQKYKL